MKWYKQEEYADFLKYIMPVNLDSTHACPCWLQTAVIGAAEGLYSFLVDDTGKLKSRSRIEGLTNVHQILLVQTAGVALFIAGMECAPLLCTLTVFLVWNILVLVSPLLEYVSK